LFVWVFHKFFSSQKIYCNDFSSPRSSKTWLFQPTWLTQITNWHKINNLVMNFCRRNIMNEIKFLIIYFMDDLYFVLKFHEILFMKVLQMYLLKFMDNILWCSFMACKWIIMDVKTLNEYLWMKENYKWYSMHEIISFWNSMKLLVIVSSNHEEMSLPLVWLFNFPPKCNFNIIIYTWNSCNKWGSSHLSRLISSININFLVL
jgi:hypothetical protein